MVAANRGIRSSGPYRLIRHPMYAGYVLTNIGFLLLYPTGWNLAVYATAWGLQLARLLAEERFLGAVPEYRDYMATVRYRLVPGLF